MKLKYLFLSVFIGGYFVTNAQSISHGNKIITLGIGLGPSYYSGVEYIGIVPPLSASFEYIIQDNLINGKGAIGVGGYVGFATYKWEENIPGYGLWGYNSGNIFIGPTGTFHYSFVDKLDTYGGLFIGYNIVDNNEFGVAHHGHDYHMKGSGYVWALYTGGRYFFSNNFAVMLELGYGITYLNTGIALKF